MASAGPGTFEKFSSVHIQYLFVQPYHICRILPNEQIDFPIGDTGFLKSEIQCFIPAIGCGITDCPKSVVIKLRSGAMRTKCGQRFRRLTFILRHSAVMSPEAWQIAIFDVCTQIDTLAYLIVGHRPEMGIGMCHHESFTPTSAACRAIMILSRGEQWPVAKIIFASAHISMTRMTSGNTFPESSRTGIHFSPFLRSGVVLRIQRRHPDAAAQTSRGGDGLLGSIRVHTISVDTVHA